MISMDPLLELPHSAYSITIVTQVLEISQDRHNLTGISFLIYRIVNLRGYNLDLPTELLEEVTPFTAASALPSWNISILPRNITVRMEVQPHEQPTGTEPSRIMS